MLDPADLRAIAAALAPACEKRRETWRRSAAERAESLWLN
jgi:hypothetical protein